MLRYHLLEFSYCLGFGVLKGGNKLSPFVTFGQGIGSTMKRKKGIENQINVMTWKPTSAPFRHQDLHHLVVDPAVSCSPSLT